MSRPNMKCAICKKVLGEKLKQEPGEKFLAQVMVFERLTIFFPGDGPNDGRLLADFICASCLGDIQTVVQGDAPGLIQVADTDA